MFNRKRLLLFVSYTLLAALLLFIYFKDGLKAATNQLILMVVIWVWYPAANAIAKRHSVIHNEGWKKIGPSWSLVTFATLPIIIVIDVALTMTADHLVFGVPLDFRFLFLFYNAAWPNLIFFLPCLYGILFGWVWRLRWNESGVERRDIFFRTRWVDWSDIASVTNPNFFGYVTATLSDGTCISIPAHRAGISELEKDAQRHGVQGV